MVVIANKIAAIILYMNIVNVFFSLWSCVLSMMVMIIMNV